MQCLAIRTRSAFEELVRRGCALAAVASAFSGLVIGAGGGDLPGGQALRRSDVVFMYQADRSLYEDYGATMLAWGGRPTTESLAAAQGISYYGSVGMVTEFSRYYERFPERYEEGLCRDLQGKPFKVPWLTDHKHKDIPYWWCCTQQPLFRQYLEERVKDTVRAGAYGVHIDDHLGSAGALFLGGCFCERCVDGFRDYARHLPTSERKRLELNSPADLSIGETFRAWLEQAPADKPRRLQNHGLWSVWTAYHCHRAAEFMRHLRSVAAQVRGGPVPMSANAGLLWPLHLADHDALDFISAEIDHQAADERLSDLPVFAYRLADAVRRPLASTASGQDWAFIKERNRPGLVCSWIALSYANGHALMAPHRQWCYTEARGTHWYEGPRARFAPLYRFVRSQAPVLDRYEAHADVALIIPHRSFVTARERWFEIGSRLTRANVSWKICLGGDDLVAARLAPESLAGVPRILCPEPDRLEEPDRQLMESLRPKGIVVKRVEDILNQTKPAVRVVGDAPVWLFPRVTKGRAVIHIVNHRYIPQRDEVAPVSEVKIDLDCAALGLADIREATLISPRDSARELPVRDGQVVIPAVDLWSLLVLGWR